MTDTCKRGECIAGFIANQEVKASEWANAEQRFLGKIELWNELTKRHAIPHIGFVQKAKFCTTCGSPVHVEAPVGPRTDSFQARVRSWLLNCFGPLIAADTGQRNQRFLEESLELVQANGLTEDEANELVTYVYNRPAGERFQEVGGVMVTLGALCQSIEIEMMQAGEVELARIEQPEVMQAIQAKQLSKPAMSARPGVYPEQARLEHSKTAGDDTKD